MKMNTASGKNAEQQSPICHSPFVANARVAAATVEQHMKISRSAAATVEQHMKISRSPDVPPKLPTSTSPHRQTTTKTRSKIKSTSPRRSCCYTIGAEQNEQQHADGHVESSPRTPIRCVQRNISDVSMESSLLISPCDDYDDFEDSASYDNSSVEEFAVPMTAGKHEPRGDDLLGQPRSPGYHPPLHRPTRSMEEYDEGDFEVPLQTCASPTIETPRGGHGNLIETSERRHFRRRKQLYSQRQGSCRSLDSLPMPPTRKASFVGGAAGKYLSRSFNGLSPMDSCETSSLSDISPIVPSRTHML
eukprot:CAMPEP_0117080078 /NCGR_PEP_ID=MMETSP0472-20121206/56508_1 /TAXON_ID=693140 ORGANISM="Tiarina fusus, Strain LIS" /NCGR_SAMPLE_ID=MMETSP0472 /ASSEMBLY_ACC=CAM_ASM_000603 /LENGTH=303 /DNA_ID=CAMNT_0004807587 /DNA_START=165 /DNA_END=1076 /DNA_ORIENTATION=-